MSLKGDIIVVSSTHQSEHGWEELPAVRQGVGEPFLARESQNGFLKIIIC
jgi:hypothetical protein